MKAAGEFAQPILRHLRALVHRACPEVEEAVKWGRPVFLYRGRILFYGRVQRALHVWFLGTGDVRNIARGRHARG